MTLSSNDANRHEHKITIYTEMVSRLLRRYSTDAVIANADEKISNLEQRSSALSDFSQILWGLKLRCGGIYNEQTLKGLFSKGIDLNIRSIMRLSWAENREATLEDQGN